LDDANIISSPIPRIKGMDDGAKQKMDFCYAQTYPADFSPQNSPKHFKHYTFMACEVYTRG